MLSRAEISAISAQICHKLNVKSIMKSTMTLHCEPIRTQTEQILIGIDGHFDKRHFKDIFIHLPDILWSEIAMP